MVVDKKKILDKLLSNIKKRPGTESRYESNVNTNTYNLRNRKVPPPITKEFNIDENKNKKVNFYLSSTQKDNKDKKIFSDMMNAPNTDNNTNNIENINTDTYKQSNLMNQNQNLYGVNAKSVPNRTMNLRSQNQTTNAFNIDTKANDKNNNINMISEKKKETEIYEDNIYEEEESSKGEIYNVVCNVIPREKKVKLYNVDLNNTNLVNLEFSPILGISHFLEESAWVNLNNKLYILGGVDDFSKSTQIFLEYDPSKNCLRRLPDSKFTHSRHSLYAYNNQIFVAYDVVLNRKKYHTPF